MGGYIQLNLWIFTEQGRLPDRIDRQLAIWGLQPYRDGPHGQRGAFAGRDRLVVQLDVWMTCGSRRPFCGGRGANL